MKKRSENHGMTIRNLSGRRCKIRQRGSRSRGALAQFGLEAHFVKPLQNPTRVANCHIKVATSGLNGLVPGINFDKN